MALGCSVMVWSQGTSCCGLVGSTWEVRSSQWGRSQAGQRWDKAWGQGHKDAKEHLGRATGQSTGTGPQRWERVWGQGHRDGTEFRDRAEHGKRDTGMAQGMGTGTRRWDRIQGQGTGTGPQRCDRARRQGHRWEKASGQGHRDGTEYKDRGRAWGQRGDLQDFLLPRDLLRSLLAQGRGLALCVTDFTSRSMISSEASSGELGTSSWAGEPWAGVVCPVPAQGQQGCWHQPCPASWACLECPCHPAPTPAGPAAADRGVRGGGQQALHALVTCFHLLLGTAGHYGRRRSGLSDARELLGLQQEERRASGTWRASPGGGGRPSVPVPR